MFRKNFNKIDLKKDSPNRDFTVMIHSSHYTPKIKIFYEIFADKYYLFLNNLSSQKFTVTKFNTSFCELLVFYGFFKCNLNFKFKQ